MVTDPVEVARRVRAARAYAGLTREELARRGPLTYKQLKLVEDGRRRITTREELVALGAACDVPVEFMEVGFEGAQGVYAELARIFAAVLSQDFPTILAEAERMGVQLPSAAPDGPPRGAARPRSNARAAG